MPLIADVHADVVQERGVLEPFPLLRAEAVFRRQLIEQLEAEARHLLRVRREIVAALRERNHAAAAHIRVTIGALDLGAVAPRVVEHEALAQREVAERQLRGA